MGPLFTQYLRSLEGDPDERLALAVWKRLRELLKSELKKRGLWQNPPSYLGIYGWSTWSEAGEGPLEELAAECYSFIFVDRLGRLLVCRRVPDADGPRTRDYLATLWWYLRFQTGAGEPDGPSEPLVVELADAERFSHRRISQVLGIPRERLPGLFSTLRQLATRAQLLARSGQKGRPRASRKEAG